MFLIQFPYCTHHFIIGYSGTKPPAVLGGAFAAVLQPHPAGPLVDDPVLTTRVTLHNPDSGQLVILCVYVRQFGRVQSTNCVQGNVLTWQLKKIPEPFKGRCIRITIKFPGHRPVLFVG